MEKVDEKWLKRNGWKCWVDEVTEDWDYSTKSITHHTIYTKSLGTVNLKYGKYKRARWEHKYTQRFLVSNKTGNKYFIGVSNYYMFSAFGDKFSVENSISHRKFDAEKIKAACTLCGIE